MKGVTLFRIYPPSDLKSFTGGIISVPVGSLFLPRALLFIKQHFDSDVWAFEPVCPVGFCLYRGLCYFKNQPFESDVRAFEPVCPWAVVFAEGI